MEILDLLSYMQPIENQRLGIELALKEADLSILLEKAEDPEYSENIAKIFTSLEYAECKKYFDELFSWIEDINTPGAVIVFDYLTKAPGALIYDSFIKAYEAAKKRRNTEMQYTLIRLKEQNYSLKEFIGE